MRSGYWSKIFAVVHPDFISEGTDWFTERDLGINQVRIHVCEWLKTYTEEQIHKLR